MLNDFNVFDSNKEINTSCHHRRFEICHLGISTVGCKLVDCYAYH